MQNKAKPSSTEQNKTKQNKSKQGNAEQSKKSKGDKNNEYNAMQWKAMPCNAMQFQAMQCHVIFFSVTWGGHIVLDSGRPVEPCDISVCIKLPDVRGAYSLQFSIPICQFAGFPHLHDAPCVCLVHMAHTGHRPEAGESYYEVYLYRNAEGNSSNCLLEK